MAQDNLRADIDPNAEARPGLRFDANTVTQSRSVRSGAFDPRTGQIDVGRLNKGALAEADDLIESIAATISDDEAQAWQDFGRSRLAESGQKPGNTPAFRDIATAKRIIAHQRAFPGGYEGDRGGIDQPQLSRTFSRAIKDAPSDVYNATVKSLSNQAGGMVDTTRAVLGEGLADAASIVSPKAASAIRGASEVARKEIVRTQGQIDETFPSQGAAGTVGEVIGNVAPWMIGMGQARAASLAAAELGAAGKAASGAAALRAGMQGADLTNKAVMASLVASSVSQGSNRYLQWAEDNGLNPEDPTVARTALGIGVGYGVAEYLGERVGVGYIAKRATPRIIGALGKAAMQKDTRAARVIAEELFGATAVNFGEEALTQMAQNAIDQQYDDTVKLTDGVMDAGGVGGGVGVLQTLVGLAMDPRTRANLRKARRDGDNLRIAQANQQTETPSPIVPPAPKIRGRVGFASEGVRTLANGYLAKNAERINAPVLDVTSEGEIDFDDQFAKTVGAAYQNIPHDPNNPEVAAAYAAFKSEIKEQWLHAQANGYSFEPFESKPGNEQPYKSSSDAAEKIDREKRVLFFQGGEMPADHPLAEVDPDTGYSYNDLFRGIHDLYGHVANGNEFGPRGETAASQDHSRMFSPEAQKAMLFETLGQNSWVNYGPHILRADGSVPISSDPDYVPQSQRPYAEQKANIIPSEIARQFQEGSKYQPPAKTIDTRIEAARAQIEQAKKDISVEAGKYFGRGGEVTMGTMHVPAKLTYHLYQYAEGVAKYAVLNGIKGVDNLKKIVMSDKSESGGPVRRFAQQIAEFADGIVSGRGEWPNDVDPEDLHSTRWGGWIGPDGKGYEVGTMQHGKSAEQLAGKYGFKQSDNSYYSSEDRWRIPAVGAGLVRVVNRGGRIVMQGEKLTEQAKASVKSAALAAAKAGREVDVQIGDAVVFAAAYAPIGETMRKIEAIPSEEYQAPKTDTPVPGALPRNSKMKNARPGSTIVFDQLANSIGDAAKKWKAIVRNAAKMGVTSRVAHSLTTEELQTMSKQVAERVSKVWGELPPTAEYEAAAIAGLAKKGWYERAAVTLRLMFGTDANQFAALLAAQSPRQPVIQNLKMSLATWDAWTRAGRPTSRIAITKLIDEVGMGAAFPSRMLNSISVLSNTTGKYELSGQKVSAFHQNLIGNMNAVTNDVWMAVMGGIDQKMFGTQAGYLASSSKIREAARNVSMSPAEVQETVWSFIKTLSEVMAHVDNPKDAVEIAMSRVHDTPEFATMLLDDKEISDVLDKKGIGDSVRTYLREQRSALDAAKSRAEQARKSVDTRRLESIARRIPEGNKARVRIRDGVGEGSAILHGGTLFDEIARRSGAYEESARKQIVAAKAAIKAELAKESGRGGTVTLGTVRVPAELAKALVSLGMGVVRLAAAKGITKLSEVGKMLSAVMDKQPAEIKVYKRTIEKMVYATLRNARSVEKGAAAYNQEKIDKSEMGVTSAIDRIVRIQDRANKKLKDATSKAEKDTVRLQERADKKLKAAVDSVQNKADADSRKVYIRKLEVTDKRTGKQKTVGIRAADLSARRTEKKEFTRTDMLNQVLKRAVRFTTDAWRASRMAKRIESKARLDALISKYQSGELVSGFSREKAAELTKKLLPPSIRSKYVRMVMAAETDRQAMRVLQRAQREYTLMVGRQLYNRTIDLASRKMLRRLTDEDFKVVSGLLGQMQSLGEMLRKPKKLTPDEVRDTVLQVHDLHNQVASVIHTELNSQKIKLADKVISTKKAIAEVSGKLDEKERISLDRTVDEAVNTPSLKRLWYKGISARAIILKIEAGKAGIATKLLDQLKGAYKKHLAQQRIDYKKLDDLARAAGYKSFASLKVETSGLLGRSSTKQINVNLTNAAGARETVKITLGEAMHIYGMDPETVALAHRAEDAKTSYPGDVQDRVDEFENYEDYQAALDAAMQKASKVSSQGFVFKAQGQTSRVYTMTRSQRAQIIGKIPKNLRVFMDGVKAYANGTRAERARKAAHDLTGTLPTKVDGYQPRSRFQQARVGHRLPGWANQAIQLLEEAGFTKDRSTTTKTPLVIGDALDDTWEPHLDKSSRLIHLASQTRDLSMVLQDGDVHREIGQRFGRSAQDKIANMIEDFVGSGAGGGSLFSKIMRFVSQRIQRGLISINPSSMLKNLVGGIARLAALKSTADITKAIAMAAKSGPTLDRLLDRSAYLWHRTAGDPTRIFGGMEHTPGVFDRASFGQAMKATASNLAALAGQTAKFGEQGYINRVGTRIGDVDRSIISAIRSVRLYSIMEHAINRVGMAISLLEARRDMPGASGARIAREAIRRTEKLVEATQASWDPDQSNGWQQDIARDGTLSAFVPFASDPGRVCSLVDEAFTSQDGTPAEQRARKSKALTAIAVSALLSAGSAAVLSKSAFQLYGQALGGGLSQKEVMAAPNKMVWQAARTFLNETVGNVQGVNYLVDMSMPVGGKSKSPLTSNPTIGIVDDVWSQVAGAGGAIKGVMAGNEYQRRQATTKLLRSLGAAAETGLGVYTGLGPIYQRAKGFGQGLGIVRDSGDPK